MKVADDSQPAGVYETPGGRSFLDHLLSLNPSERTRAAVDRVVEQDRQRRPAS
jgi:hypothetical protein